MFTVPRLFTGLAILFLFVSSATSWTITFYKTMEDCMCTKGPCRKEYLSYEGSTGRSECITTGVGSGNSNCAYTTDGGLTFGKCDHYMQMGAFAIGADTTCDWGHYCTGAGSAAPGSQGKCYDASEWEPEELYFSPSDHHYIFTITKNRHDNQPVPPAEMQLSLITTILTLAILAPRAAMAWTLTVYPSTQDCTGDTFIKYDSNNASPQCFVAGRPGADTTCQVTTNGGKTWTGCADNAPASDPSKLSFRIAKGNRCAWASVGDACAGTALTSDGECLKGKNYGGGREMRFQCADE
ncbi:hypothetical protein PRZ48_011989 [Zasmidium cellare]|uniref:Uncharacterized protein n=1 Tax=Zasmidium cellare TaxID=395010 RepID=A0ABR0E7X4_ZASCE|nr:hypothetical protein PRZ48_011989 [Zasmidium cellare]